MKQRRRVLIVGAGDVVQRALPWLTMRYRVYALARRPEAAAALRAAGVTPVAGDLDKASSLRRLAGLAHMVIHSAPPGDHTEDDPRSRNLLAALARRGRPPRRLVYVSTSGVYGDCAGAKVDETRPLRPATQRAHRRVAAERSLRAAARRWHAALALLRAPGIYAANRLSLERLRRGDPVLVREEDVITNHVHADDLARAVCLALHRGHGLRAYNLCDDSRLAMGDYYEAMADVFGLPRPPRRTRAECAAQLSPVTLSFMSESRVLDNTRAKRELCWQPRYPGVIDGLRAIAAQTQVSGD